MKITDMTAIDLTIIDKSQHDRLRKDIVEIFPEIRQNYSDGKRDLIRFICALEQVYKENENVDKIKIEFQGVIDEHDIAFNTIFRNAETNSIIEGESAKKLSICLEDIFCSDESKYDYDNHDDEDYSDPVKIIAYGMDERYFFDEISQTSREDRFNLYKKMVDFSGLNYSDSIQNIINALENNEEIPSEYKKVNFLGKGIDITVIDFKNGKFELDVSEKSIAELKKTLELNEEFYVLNKIKKDMLKLSSGLDLTHRLIAKFERSDSNDSNRNYKDYAFELMDAHGNTVSTNVSFAFVKYLPEPRIEKGVTIENIDKEIAVTCFNPLYRSSFLEKWKLYEDLANKSNVDESVVSLKDLSLSDYSIKTANGHKRFIENISNAFPQIEQNYDDSKGLLVNFVLLMEKVYAEHPNVEKIGIEVYQESGVEDARNNLYIHGMDFTLVNADTQQPLSGDAVRKVSEYIQDSYAEKAYSEGTYEAGNMTLAVMETDLYFHDFAHTSRDNRFSLYRGMIDYNYIHNKEALDSFVDAVEKGKLIEDSYKTVNLLGEDVKIKTMGLSDGFLSKDATSRDVESLKKQLINIESAYVINNIKEAVLRSNLDIEDKLDISFNVKTPNNYSGYICRIEDVNKNRLDINVDLAFPKWFGFDKASTIVRPKEDLGEALSRKFTDYSSTENLNKKIDKNAEDIEQSYTNVNDFIKPQRPRMKM